MTKIPKKICHIIFFVIPKPLLTVIKDTMTKILRCANVTCGNALAGPAEPYYRRDKFMPLM